jgi:DNA-binding MarR family transcriptional regulator
MYRLIPSSREGIPGWQATIRPGPLKPPGPDTLEILMLTHSYRRRCGPPSRQSRCRPSYTRPLPRLTLRQASQLSAVLACPLMGARDGTGMTYDIAKPGTGMIAPVTPTRYMVQSGIRDKEESGCHSSVGATALFEERVWTMISNDVSDGLAGMLRTAIVELVRRDGPDLSARQLGVFLTCYLETEAQTVRGLAARLNVSKPAITRALDRLSEFDLVRRKTDPLDRRSVLVQRTATGMAFQRELRTVLRDAASAMHLTVGTAPGGRQRVGAESALATR